jgi:hypothetical protein
MAQLLRQLIRQLRLSHKQGPIRKTPIYNYIIEQYRSHAVTSAKHCRQQNELQHLAETYLCLIQSNARQLELSQMYLRGERSIADAARIVGLKLPEQKT